MAVGAGGKAHFAANMSAPSPAKPADDTGLAAMETRMSASVGYLSMWMGGVLDCPD